MFPQLQQQAPPPSSPPPPPPQHGRKFRQRSRSFDAGFVAQLQAFHLSQQAFAKQAQQQQQHSSSTPQQQQQQQHLQQLMMAAAMAMPHYAMPPLTAHSASPPVSPRPTPNRERQLRSAYLSPTGLQPPSSPRPASPPSTTPGTPATAAASNGRYHSPRAARGQLLHASPPPPSGSMQSGAAAGYPGTMLSPAMPLFPMQPLLFPGLVPPHQLLQQTQLLQLQHQQLMHHMQMQQSPSGRPFYGFINVGASSPRPGQPPPPPATAPPPTAPAAPFPSAVPMFNSPLVAASVVTPKRPRVLHVHPTVPGENHARSRPSPHTHAHSPHRSMLELHNDYVEVIYTDATRGGPHLMSSAAQRKKQKKARAAALATAAEAEAAAASAAVVPEAPPLTTEEKKVFAKLASAAMLAEIQARRDKLNARMKGREAAALQRITEQEAERTRAAEAEKAKERALQAAKAKQREAMAESALSRAKQVEQSKARSALFAEIEAKAQERENKALARLKAQQGTSASLFNPTLAYALKVESSHHRGDARSPRKGDINRQRGSVSVAHPAPGFSAEKPHTNHAHAHARKASLYDGMDIDMMHSLGPSSGSASATAASAAGGGANATEDTEGAHEDGDEVIDEEGEGDHHEDGAEEEQHEEESKQEHSQLSLSVSHHHAPPQHHSPTHKDSAAGSTPKASAAAAAASARPKHNRSLSSIAKEHIASQLTKISSKHTGASVKLQRLRTQTKARAQAAQAEKQRKMDEIRWAREAELRRMHQALTAMEAQTAGAAGGTKVESQFVLAMPLAKAAKAGDLLAIEELSRDKNETGGDIVSWVNRHDSAGSTAIFHATWMAHGPVLHLLFNLGADPNRKNNRQNTALHLACDRAHYPIVKLLLERGADPSLRNHEHNACYEMQSRNSAESLEMALYIRQCLEDLILVQSGIGEAAEGVGLGMHASVNVDYTPGGAAAVAAAAGASEAAAKATEAATAAAEEDPAREARVRALASAVSASPALSLPHSYLDSINQYISKRLHLAASLRRVKLKIWSAVRVKLRLGAFSTMAKQRALEAQQEAEREATRALAAEAEAEAAQGAAQHFDAEEEAEEQKQQEEKAAEDSVPAITLPATS